MKTTFLNFDIKKELSIRGRKIYGDIPFALRPDGCTYINIPVMMVIGKNEGRVIVASGCLHGDEVEGPEGIIKTFQSLDENQMSGSFIGVPVVNIPAFSDVSRYNSMDFVPLDLNRIFPGDANGSITQRIAHYYLETFVKNADAAIDIHGGGNNLALAPLTLYQNFGDEISQHSRNMAMAMGFDGLWQMNECTGHAGTFDEEAYFAGVPTIVPEIGGQVSRLTYRKSDPERLYDGICNVLRYWKVLEGEVKTFDTQYHVEMEYIKNNSGGIHTPLKKCGERVKQGDAISKIVNVYGEEVETVTAPFDAIVMGVWVTPVLQPGGWVYMLGRAIE